MSNVAAPGQPIQAQTINDLYDAVQPQTAPRPGAGGVFYKGFWDWAVNYGSSDIPAGDATFCSDQAINPALNPAGRAETILKIGEASTGTVVVAIETIRAGKGGRVLVMGMIWANSTGSGNQASLVLSSGQASAALSLSVAGEIPVLATAAGRSRVMLGGSGAGGGNANWEFCDSKL